MYKPIQVIAHFEENGQLTPYRVKYTDSADANHVVRIERIVSRSQNIFNGIEMRIFHCSATLHGREKIFILHYEVEKCLWFLQTS